MMNRRRPTPPLPLPAKPHRRLNRRGALRGLGAVVALPFLESLRPRAARAQGVPAASVPLRFLGYYVPCGIYMDRWRPSASGRDYTLSPTLSSLAPIQDQLLVLSGLENYAADDQGNGAGGHARGTATFLTSTHPAKNGVLNNISFDQLVAQNNLGQTRLKSIELGCEGGLGAGVCDSGYSCVYQRTISWGSPFTPNDKEVNPRAAFDRIFGADVLLTPEERALRQKQDLSLLDFVVDETRRVKPRLGARDRRKLDEYLTGVRELETRIDSLQTDDRCALPEQPSGATTDVSAYVGQMLDLIVLAFQCDITRAATFMVANGASTRAYHHLGLSAAHHELSHHQGITSKLEGLATINAWEVEELARVLIRMSEIEEEGPAGEPVSILHNLACVMGSEISDGNRHNNDDLPVLLAGGGGGTLATGQHLLLPSPTPIANLYLTLAQVFGLAVDRFGDDGEDLLPQILS